MHLAISLCAYPPLSSDLGGLRGDDDDDDGSDGDDDDPRE